MKTRKSNPSNRGGARPGSGAKVQLPSPAITPKVYIDENSDTILRRLGSGNRSEGIRRGAGILEILLPAIQNGNKNVIDAAIEEIKPLIESYNTTKTKGSV